MDLKDKIAIVTGGANGIGQALCQRLLERDAAHVVVADLEADNAEKVAAKLGSRAEAAHIDVRSEQDIHTLVQSTEQRYGRLDIMCSNAGIFCADLPDWSVASLANDDWQRTWEVNVMAHVYAARAALPGMLTRGDGAFLLTVSAAGLLSQIGAASYSVTKHAALGFAESLAITHGDDGICVTALCPQAVETRMFMGLEGGGVAGIDGVRSPAEVADVALDALCAGQFLALPHPEVREYFAGKAENYERWLGGMRKLRRAYLPEMQQQIDGVVATPEQK